MRQLAAVMIIQRKLFFKDKGILVFYALGILVIGGIFPLFFKSIVSQMTLALFMCVTMQKQWAAESVAGERENETLESLMSTTLPTRTFLLGKVLFNFLCALVYAATMIGGLCVTRGLSGTPRELSPAGWLVAALGILGVLLVTASYGVWCSAKAETVRAAGRGPTVVCYLISLLFIILLTVLTMSESLPIEAVVLVAAIYFLTTGGVALYAVLRILGLGRSGIMEVERRGKHSTQVMAKGKRTRTSNPMLSPVTAVFVHEMHYLKTLKMVLFNFAILTLCPAGLQYTVWLMTGANDLSYGVLLTILIVPRIPTNLVAYSVGGEKAYSTAESILSTPVPVTALFWGKAAVPCLVAAVMLLLSAVLNLLTANLFACLDGSPFLFYSAGQLVLLIGVGLTTCFVMILASAILSLRAKTPRKGLYYSTLLGLVFFLPASAILYLAGGSLFWALGYFALLLGVCYVLYNKVRRVTRAELMVNL